MGVDVAEERKGLDVVVLDGDRGIVASTGGATVAAVAALATQLRPDVVCVDAPSAWASAGPSRTAERDLRCLGITAFSTPPDPGDHAFYRWMRVGHAVYAELAPAYRLYRGGRVDGTAAEVFPEATATLLAGRLRPNGEPKGAFRRQVLRHGGVDESRLANRDRVDAALCALTGLLALEGCCSWVGDPAEGALLLPVRELPAVRLVRPGRRDRVPQEEATVTDSQPR
jgi:predicted nuclease with RNAse H fold